MTIKRMFPAALSLALLGAAPAATPNHPPGFVKPEPVVLPVWPGTPPHLVAGGKPETFVNERYLNVSVPQLLVYLPAKEKANGTALIICAGGGYYGLAMCIHVENVVQVLNDRGIAVIGLKYRTHYGKNDVVADALSDGQRAVRIVRSHSAEWNINPHRVGVQGYSAGSNLCLNLLGHFDEGDPAAADPVDHFSCRPDFCVLMCPWPNGHAIGHFAILPDAPPTWIAHARDDRTAPFAFATAIDEKLKKLNVPEHLFAVDTGGHGAFHYGMSDTPGAKWLEPLLLWMREQKVLDEKQ